MQKIRDGNKLDYTCVAAVAMDDVIVVGSIVGIASQDGAIGDVIALDVAGVYELKANTAAISQGAAVYWDESAEEVTTTATDNVFLGHAWFAKASTVLVAQVRINQ